MREEYERMVLGLVALSENLEKAGADPEMIARALHAARRSLAEKYKALTPEPLRSKLYERTLVQYGDCIGPTIEYLRSLGKSWQQIAEGAMRPGPRDFF